DNDLFRLMMEHVKVHDRGFPVAAEHMRRLRMVTDRVMHTFRSDMGALTEHLRTLAARERNAASLYTDLCDIVFNKLDQSVGVLVGRFVQQRIIAPQAKVVVTEFMKAEWARF